MVGDVDVVGQPAEEIVAGAQAMMEDGLWDRWLSQILHGVSRNKRFTHR